MKKNIRKVLFMIPTLSGGGAERVVVTLLQHLDRSKFQLVLAVVDLRNEVFLSDLPEDVEVIDLKCTRVRYALPKAVHLIWHLRPDVVFSTLGHLNLTLAVFRSLLPEDVLYVARETSIVSEQLRHTFNPTLWRWAYRQFYSRFDRIICQSNYMARDLINHFFIPAPKICEIHNPVDLHRVLALSAGNQMFSPEDGVLNLIAAGRLVDVKGFDLLIGALALCADLPLRLTILGEGPLRPELEALSCRLGLTERVRFAGFEKNPYPHFAQADAFVLSSRYEGFPNVVLEALACGTPVIVTPALGGVLEILDGVSGCVVANDVSVKSLAEAIRLWAGSSRQRVPSSAVSRFAVDDIVAAYEDIFALEAISG